MSGKRSLCAGIVLALFATFWSLSAAFAQAANVADVASSSSYRLGPGDELKVVVFNEPDLSGKFVVAQAGTVDYPLVGSVAAEGLTIAEFAAALSDKVKLYILEPKVSVEIAAYRPFFILGEVVSPGTYPYSPNLTVMNAIATASGYTYRANRGKVYIKHANESAERAYDVNSSTPVTPGDTLRIPARLF